jgi:protein crumbs
MHGACEDRIAEYKCLCNAGYEGVNCDAEINECERYEPCQRGTCMDRIDDYICNCETGWGGKNCSVTLKGCKDVKCLFSGTCIPWLIGEDDHKANCSCTDGYDGERCQSRTTFSLSGDSDSYIRVSSDRRDGYELHMRFRTTLGNGLVAIGQGNAHFTLRLSDGALRLHSNLISEINGMGPIGGNLHDTKWVKVYVAVNSSHLTLGVNDRLQATQPVNLAGENDTVFFDTFIGGIVQDQNILANGAPPFTGCIQDITVNGIKITEEDFKNGVEKEEVEQSNTVPGCPREEQCEPNPCENNGFCTDLWKKFLCTCNRPFLGPSCQFSKLIRFVAFIDK